MNATSRRILILAVLILKSCRTEAADEPAVAPLVTLTMNGISPFNVSDFLHDSILNTGLAESVTESIDQELIRQPYNLSPKVARLQGMSVFWSPHRPMNMVTASFHQVLPGEMVDLSKPVPDFDSAHFSVKNAGPDRWVHGWHSTQDFDQDSDQPLTSHYYRRDKSLIWLSSSSDLLTATLPSIGDPFNSSSRFSINISNSAIPHLLRLEISSSINAAADVAMQRRDRESTNTWIGRTALVEFARVIGIDVVADNSELTGILTTDHNGLVRGDAELSCANPQSLAKLMSLTSSSTRLTGVRHERPWILLRVALRNNGLLRNVLERLKQHLGNDDAHDTDTRTLINALSKSENIEIAFAGISNEDDVPAWVIGWHFKHLHEAERQSEDAVRRLFSAFWPSLMKTPSASAGTLSERWLIFGSQQPQSLADRINLANINAGTERSGEFASVELDLQRFYPPATGSIQSSTDQAENSGFASRLSRILAPAIGRLQQFTSENSDGDWKARVSLSGAEGKLSLRLRCGRIAAKLFTAGALQWLTEAREQARAAFEPKGG